MKNRKKTRTNTRASENDVEGRKKEKQNQVITIFTHFEVSKNIKKGKTEKS